MSGEVPVLRAVVVRMPRDLHAAVKAKAATEERSMAQAIRYALRRYVEQAPGPPRAVGAPEAPAVEP